MVLVEFNDFSSIFLKVHHSHSRHQKTTSVLLRIILKGGLKVSNVRKPMPIIIGGGELIIFVCMCVGVCVCVCVQISQNLNGFLQKIQQGLLILPSQSLNKSGLKVASIALLSKVPAIHNWCF